MKSIIAAIPLAFLVACGQGSEAGSESKAEAVKMSAPSEPEGRDWVPAGLTLPQPHEVIQDSKLGTRIRLLQVSVKADPASEFPRWKSALEAAGYKIQDIADTSRLLFSNDKEEGQIAVSQHPEVDGYVIQIDISRKSQ
ncbi:hypothetical protein H0A58_03365 [Alcaligenaceae bacterium]|nr:hypothetical protein [Alcaligenaceae bacterium]